LDIATSLSLNKLLGSAYGDVVMTPVLDFVLRALTFVVIASTAVLAIRRFGLQRETATFLRILVSAREVAAQADLHLIAITVKLDNLGQTKIDARTGGRDHSGYMYDDSWDRFRHAGTLQIRQVASPQRSQLFDWYSLPPLSVEAVISASASADGRITPQSSDLDQINYLDDYQDPEGGFVDTDFWLEPRESYELVVPVWLPKGSYVAKAVFLGSVTECKNEEYWSHAYFFHVGPSAA
jgi:hypothetical protein